MTPGVDQVCCLYLGLTPSTHDYHFGGKNSKQKKGKEKHLPRVDEGNSDSDIHFELCFLFFLGMI